MGRVVLFEINHLVKNWKNVAIEAGIWDLLSILCSYYRLPLCTAVHDMPTCSFKEKFKFSCPWASEIFSSFSGSSAEPPRFDEGVCFHGLFSPLILLKTFPTELCRHNWDRASCTPVPVPPVQLWALSARPRQAQLQHRRVLLDKKRTLILTATISGIKRLWDPRSSKLTPAA